MRAVCTICADTVKDDFSAAPCGHTFHNICLTQWLGHQKSCPQCREKCLQRQVLKLFLDSGDTLDSSVLNSEEEIPSDELKERIKEYQTMLKEKSNALQETKKELKKIGDELTAWKSQHDSLVFKLEEERGLCESLKHHMKLMQKDKDYLEKKADEAMELRRELTKLEKVEHLLKSSRNDSHIQEVLETSSSGSLKNYVKALKNDYESLKEKKAVLTEEKKHHMQEMSKLKMKIKDMEEELYTTNQKLALMEADLQAAESERDSLTRKIHLLEKAIDSPGSRRVLTRILESPLPEKLDIKRPKLDISSNLNGSFLTEHQKVKTQDIKPQVEAATVKSVKEEVPVPMPISRPAQNSSTSCFRTGFNGFGGHTNFIPKPKFKHEGRGGKFVPRVSSSFLNKSNPKSRQMTLSMTTKLKF